MRLDAVPVRRLDARTRNLPGRILVAGPEQALELTDAAGLIWRQINGERTVRDLATRVSTEYSVDAEEAATDVWELIQALVEYEVVDLR